MKLKKNQYIIGAVVVVVVLILGGLFFVLSKNGASSQNAPSSQTQNIKQVKPSDIGLKLSLREDKKAVEMEISNLTGINTIQYEADYNADVVDPDSGESSNVPRGVVSSDISVAGQGSVKKEILLGTCSSGTCKYDKVTSGIKFLIKVVYSNGEVGSVQDSISFK